MAIFLLRHAEAVDEGPGLGDSHRHLTVRGRAAAQGVAREIAATGATLVRVVTSPLVRAVQTAEIVIATLALEDVESETWPRLAPGGSVRDAVGQLKASAGPVLAVGHEPSISALATVLLGGQTVPAFSKAEACWIEDGALRGWLGARG